jgi:hypothetical protein
LPLRDDQRPHRNYSVKELQMIDRRIQELIQVAQTFEPQSGQESVNLPQKPKVVKPVAKPTQVVQKEPVENTGTTITRETTPLDISSSNNLTGKAETDSGNELAGERPGLTYPQSAIRTMAQTAQSVSKAMVNNIQSRASRPAENGTQSASNTIVKADPSKFTDADFNEIRRRVAAGEEIRL